MEPLHNAKNQYDGKKRIDLRADFIFQMVQWYNGTMVYYCKILYILTFEIKQRQNCERLGLHLFFSYLCIANRSVKD